MTSGFSVESLEKKLSELNNSQQVIQSTSLWLIHYRKHCRTAVATWIKFLRNQRTTAKKLTLLYLANDVIQNSRKKGPEFMNEFAAVLKQAFASIARTECDDKTWSSIDRIISIWEQRQIYPPARLSEFRSAIGDRRVDAAAAGAGTSSSQQAAGSSSSNSNNNNRHGSAQKRVGKSGASQSSSGGTPAEKKQKSAGGTEGGTGAKTGGRLPDMPQPKDGVVIEAESLVRALRSLESCASRDREVRQKIASFPPEVTDPSLMQRLSEGAAAGSEAEAHKLLRMQPLVEQACILLSDFNHKLSNEMEERRSVALMLATFVQNQKDRLAATEAQVRELRGKLDSVTKVRAQLRNHLQNLPDLSLLPSVMAPLPSAGDLFNVHNVHVTDVRLLQQQQQQEQDQLLLHQQQQQQHLLRDQSKCSLGSVAESTSPSSVSPDPEYSPAGHDFPTPKS